MVIAVGTRMPRWADEGFTEFAARMPREMALSLTEVRTEPRAGKSLPAVLEAEAARIEQALPGRSRVVLLDEHGEDLDTRSLAQRLKQWLAGGEDVALIVGGPDGVAQRIQARARETLRLSSLTLPHALARVVLAEALYRAASLLRNHPYHRA